MPETGILSAILAPLPTSTGIGVAFSSIKSYMCYGLSCGPVIAI